MIVTINGKTYEAGKLVAYVEKLEKENTELKADNDARKFAMAMSEKVEKQLCKENAELEARLNAINLLTPELEKQSKAKKQQLTKAKELLKWFVWYFKEGSPNLVPYKQKVKEAEQFLKEVEEE